MSKKFYGHIVEMESIYIELDSLNLSDEERHHLAQLLESSLHHTILDAILSELSEEEKIKFLDHLSSEDHDRIWEHLNKNVDNIEEKIRIAADGLKEKLHKEISEAKKLK